jgi:hypothetical protein
VIYRTAATDETTHWEVANQNPLTTPPQHSNHEFASVSLEAVPARDGSFGSERRKEEEG